MPLLIKWMVLSSWEKLRILKVCLDLIIAKSPDLVIIDFFK